MARSGCPSLDAVVAAPLFVLQLVAFLFSVKEIAFRHLPLIQAVKSSLQSASNANTVGDARRHLHHEFYQSMEEVYFVRRGTVSDVR